MNPLRFSPDPLLPAIGLPPRTRAASLSPIVPHEPVEDSIQFRLAGERDVDRPPARTTLDFDFGSQQSTKPLLCRSGIRILSSRLRGRRGLARAGATLGHLALDLASRHR